MAAPARRSLERLALLVRGFALLVGAVVGGQADARGRGAEPAMGLGLGACVATLAVLTLALRRYRRHVQALPQPPPGPGPRRPARPAERRRVLTDSQTRRR